MKSKEIANEMRMIADKLLEWGSDLGETLMKLADEVEKKRPVRLTLNREEDFEIERHFNFVTNDSTSIVSFIGFLSKVQFPPVERQLLEFETAYGTRRFPHIVREQDQREINLTIRATSSTNEFVIISPPQENPNDES